MKTKAFLVPGVWLNDISHDETPVTIGRRFRTVIRDGQIVGQSMADILFAWKGKLKPIPGEYNPRHVVARAAFHAYADSGRSEESLVLFLYEKLFYGNPKEGTPVIIAALLFDYGITIPRVAEILSKSKYK